jgi:hypothetical protein
MTMVIPAAIAALISAGFLNRPPTQAGMARPPLFVPSSWSGRCTRRRWLRRSGGGLLFGLIGAIALGCQGATTEDYTVTAITTYTWMADYRPASGSRDRPRDTRTETFASTRLTITNGQQPPEVVGNADEKGLWWPALPPEPDVDTLESRQQSRERVEPPRLVQSATYQITFRQDGQTQTLPTQYPVYREALQAQQQGQPLQFSVDPTGSRITQVTVP